MKMITVPQLRIAQLQTFTEGVLSTTANLSEVSAQVADVQAHFDAFKEGMIRAKAISDKPMLDRTRDSLNSGFFKSVEAEQLFPHKGGAKELLDDLVKITSEYGFRLYRMTYDEQTAQTDNMLKELEGLKLGPLPAVSRWIAPLKAANDAFKATTVEYFKDVTASGDTEAATSTAPALTDSINKLFTMLFAHVQISGSEALIQAYKELITQVDAYK
ncbi:DUF6261 family protein [Marinoscillum pacificum]|uniref:DUF6261 family protein n=1 Tax=Marinoscillum pacificum TaxID=392723 RepID=UPI0021583351|nr:DUF6261 family protein [Marinoscillum pacificum]